MTTEQMPVTEEQEVVPVEATEAQPVAPAEQTVADPFDLSTIDGIRKAAEKYPTLQEWREQGFEAGRQRAAKDARLEQGTAEQAQQYHEWVVEQIRSGTDPNELKKQTPLWVKANSETSRVTTAKAYAEKVLDTFNVDERDNITQAYDLILDDPDRVDELTSAVLAEAVSRTSKSKIASLTLDDIPKDSALWTAVQSHIQSEVQKEYEAKMKEREPEPNAPPIPAGSVGSGADALTRFKSMTPEQRIEWRANASPEEVAGLWSLAAPSRG